MKIELAKMEDLKSIYKLIYDRCLWFSEKNIIGWEPDFYLQEYNLDYFKEQMKINKLFVAKTNNKICGVMLLKEEDKDYWNDNKSCYYIHHLATDINIKGIGKLLLNYAIEQCRKDNKEFLRLDGYQKSKFLNEYYKKTGFNKVGYGTICDYNYNLWEMKINAIIFKGYKIRVKCLDWEQVNTLDKYWKTFTKYIKNEKIIGLGMNWSEDYLNFDYAIGVIEDEDTLNKIKSLDFSNTDFNVEYIELKLPSLNEWETFKGKDSKIKEIYEDQIDCYNRSYDYELEFIDSKGNIEIKIHFID